MSFVSIHVGSATNVFPLIIVSVKPVSEKLVSSAKSAYRLRKRPSQIEIVKAKFLQRPQSEETTVSL